MEIESDVEEITAPKKPQARNSKTGRNACSYFSVSFARNNIIYPSGPFESVLPAIRFSAKNKTKPLLR